MDLPLPKNLPMLIPNATKEQAELISRLLSSNQTDVETNLIELSRYWKIHVWFSEPVEILGRRGWTRPKKDAEGHMTRMYLSGSHTVSEYTFSKFFNNNGQCGICYVPTRSGRHGYYFPLSKVVRYEPLINSFKEDRFSTYEDFKKKFDRFFITEDEIQKLWNQKSCQHGKQYCPSDFHRLGPRGREVLVRFMRRFKGIEADINSEIYETYTTLHHFGRDVKISHGTNLPYVYYSSEFQGCGNGRYGLLANKNEFLWLEDD